MPVSASTTRPHEGLYEGCLHTPRPRHRGRRAAGHRRRSGVHGRRPRGGDVHRLPRCHAVLRRNSHRTRRTRRLGARARQLGASPLLRDLPRAAGERAVPLGDVRVALARPGLPGGGRGPGELADRAPAPRVQRRGPLLLPLPRHAPRDAQVLPAPAVPRARERLRGVLHRPGAQGGGQLQVHRGGVREDVPVALQERRAPRGGVPGGGVGKKRAEFRKAFAKRNRVFIREPVRAQEEPGAGSARVRDVSRRLY